MSEKNGGPAFPGEHPTGQVEYVDGVGNKYVFEPHEGMTLRDYFAAKAMQGFCTSINQDTTWDQDAATAYRVANAMLKARES